MQTISPEKSKPNIFYGKGNASFKRSKFETIRQIVLHLHSREESKGDLQCFFNSLASSKNSQQSNNNIEKTKNSK